MSLSPPPVDEEDQEPRRGGRTRKPVEKFQVSGTATKRGKRKEINQADSDSDLSESDSDAELDNSTPTRGKKRKSTGGAGTTKKAAKATSSTKKKGKKAGIANAEQGEIDGASGVKNDSPLFNAFLSPDIALQPLIDEWIETFQQAAGDEVSEQASIHEIVTMFIRCCGLNSEIEQAEAIDTDGITDAVERIQDESVRVASASYPLTSRGKQYNAFRKNLDYFLHHLIDSLSNTPILFDTPETSSHNDLLLPLLLNWLNCMSTSPLRPIRHTATHMALKLNSALCDVAASVSKDLSLKQRQKEAEVKKSGTSNAAQKRVKDAEEKVAEAQGRKQRVEEMFQEIFDVMFVHRVRDADPAIRTDCFRELGAWAKKYPEYYVSTSYLTYFTKGCNDQNSHARLETVKALSSLYSKDSFINNARTVTLRLVPRLIEMALRDVEHAVRVTAINVITLIDKTGILADEDESQREKVARLIFDQDFKVRKAVGGFIGNLWEEKKESLKTEWSGARAAKKKRAANISEDDMAAYLDWKALATMLVEISQSLDDPAEPSTSSQQPITSSINALTRAKASVESICAEYELWKDWQGLVDYLLLDHSTADQDIWLSSEDEETFMLQVLIALIQREDQDEDEEDRSKTLMKILPRLFAKHQTDVGRIGGILAMLGHINLGLYLDMRKASAYDTLWDDVTKQFLQHTDPSVLESAIKAINHLSSNASMAAANSTKLTELQETLFASLRDEIGSDEVALLSLEEESIDKLEAITLRILLLEKSRDLTDVMEDEEGQSSGWDIICAFAERGRLGYKEEAKMVEYAVQVILYHMTWLFRRFTEDDVKDNDKVSALKSKRDKAVEVFQDLTLGDNTNTVDTVRRQAFVCFLTLHLLFSYRPPKDKDVIVSAAAKACPLTVEDEIQHRLGGAFLAAAEKYASERETHESEGATEAPEDIKFLHLSSILVAAIRKGVLEIEHAKEPLSHYGRLGSTYDAVVRKLVDALRDEGIYNKESETVQHVAGSALQQSFTLFLDSDSHEPAAPLALSKLLANAFTIHGNHFTVLKQLHPSDVSDFHLEALDYIARRISNYVKQERAAKKGDQKTRLQMKRFQALTFFKPLLLLLQPVTPEDALKINSHLNDAMSSTGVEVTVNKAWEAYRAYERRLDGIASKDPTLKAASRKVVQEEREDTVVNGDEDELDDQPTTPSRERVAANRNGNGDRSSPLSPTSEPEDNDGDEPATSTPRKRQREEVSPPASEDDRSHHSPPPENDESMQLDVDEPEDDDDLELTLEGVVPSQRERSESVEPTVKRRRTVKRF
ncbi:uncharacterized protein IL334_007502 [Kwoniella shivajii]|uniref:SCD domain-containing protein n=1 Tax=Kwoniella shivajii TaxID=564305 RepID=A0ABZ1DB40_9TREE|nr:hypothetical protein IL334_007502 [Kwoniella shivajii]